MKLKPCSESLPDVRGSTVVELWAPRKQCIENRLNQSGTVIKRFDVGVLVRDRQLNEGNWNCDEPGHYPSFTDSALRMEPKGAKVERGTRGFTEVAARAKPLDSPENRCCPHWSPNRRPGLPTIKSARQQPSEDVASRSSSDRNTRYPEGAVGPFNALREPRRA